MKLPNKGDSVLVKCYVHGWVETSVIANKEMLFSDFTVMAHKGVGWSAMGIHCRDYGRSYVLNSPLARLLLDV
jgi:hypothetical protein